MNNRKKKVFFMTIFFALTISSTAYADFVWPALYLEKSNFSWWVIISGLVIEFLFVRALTRSSLVKSVLIDITMNFASSILGVICIPVAGIAWEFFPGVLLYKVFNIGTFNPGTWMATCLFAVFINTFIEKIVIEKAYKYRLGKRGFWWLALANTLSVGIAFISMLLFPPQV